ncbi:MAG: aminopeptidase P family protein [Actinomycetota bacterium]
MDRGLRRDRLAARLEELGADAFLVTHLPNVRYLCGYTGSNGQALIAREGARFFTDGRYTEQSRREVPDMERLSYGGDGFPAMLQEACSQLGVSRVAFEASFLTYKQFQDFSDRVGELIPARDEVGRLRWVKDAEELALIEEAQAITDTGFKAILPELREGVTERELARDLERRLEEHGAEGPAFDTIAAFGEDAAEPHHQPTDRALRHGDIVKLDFGARYDGYHSDMTRTVAFGEPSHELRTVYALVREAQQVGIDAVRAGVRGKDVDRAARAVIEAAGYGEAFGHGLGHGVGLEIHEGPTLSSTFEGELPAGAVVTVEPGIYLPGIGGVRIEDMVEVTDEGCRVLPATQKELVIV